MDLQGKELLTWLREGLRDNSLPQEPGVDAIWKKFNDDEDVIPEGENTTGYRVMYMYKDPSTGKQYYQTPLTVGRKDSFDQMEQDFQKAAKREGADTSAFLLSDTEGIHHTDEGPGFYYFRDKDVAEDYMKVIALGLKGARGAKSFSDDWYKERTYSGDGHIPDINLALFKVEGVAMRKPWDEGETMNDMHIDPTPVVNVSLRNVYGLANDMYKALSRPEGLQKVQKDTQRLAIFTGIGTSYHQGYSELLRNKEQNLPGLKLSDPQILHGWEDQKRFEKETVFKEIYEDVTGFDYGPIEPAKEALKRDNDDFDPTLYLF